jgi:CBS domain-containing protein
MFVKEIMTKTPACCAPEDDLEYVTKLMLDHNCGAIPVCDGAKIIGVITDRDIAVRGFTKAGNPLSLEVRELMTQPVFTIGEWDHIDNAIELMEEKQVRRLPVVDRNGRIVGILSQSDLAKQLSAPKLAQLLKGVSMPVEETIVVPAP